MNLQALNLCSQHLPAVIVTARPAITSLYVEKWIEQKY